MDYFVHYDLLDSHTQVYSSVSQISSHSYFDYPFADLFLFKPPFVVIFLLVSFSLGDKYSHSFFFIYQTPPIACNNYWCFSLVIVGLGSSNGIF